MGEIVETAKVLVQPAMKLLEMCEKGIGTLYEPRHMRKMADAEAYKIKQLSEAIGDASYLPVNYEKGDLSMNTLDVDDLAKRAEFREKYQKIREQANIETVIGNAYHEVLECSEVVDEPVDEDWATRFFNIVKEINTKEMQYLWGKILAGEVKHPGSFSMRTLETIRNLSQKEAEVFQKLQPLIMQYRDTYFFSSLEELNKKHGLNYADVLTLDECGLISSQSIGLNFDITDKITLSFFTKKIGVVLKSTSAEKNEIRVSVYKLTKAGQELAKILSWEPNDEYIADFAEEVKKNNRNCEVSLHEIIKISYDNTSDVYEIEYEDESIVSKVNVEPVVEKEKPVAVFL